MNGFDYRAWRAPFWQLPHSLGLDAALIGAGWVWLCREMVGLGGERLPVVLVGLAVWLVYVADRWMDVLRGAGSVSVRHRVFVEWRGVVAVCWVMILGLDLWYGVKWLDAVTLFWGLGVCLLAVCYTIVRQALGRRFGGRRVFIALLFGMSVWVFCGRSVALLGVASSFGLLCLANLLLIGSWEREADGVAVSSRFWNAGIVLLASISGVLVAWVNDYGLLIYAFIFSGVGLVWLSLLGFKCSRLEWLRVCADACLLTPWACLYFVFT